MLVAAIGPTTSVRLVRLTSVPCSSPWCSSLTWRERSAWNAGKAIPPAVKRNMIAKTIQPFVISAIATNAAQSQATPSRIAPCSPRRRVVAIGAFIGPVINLLEVAAFHVGKECAPNLHSLADDNGIGMPGGFVWHGGDVQPPQYDQYSPRAVAVSQFVRFENLGTEARNDNQVEPVWERR